MSARPINDSLVIGITGPIGGGVSTVAGVLESSGFTRLRLSDPIKKVYEERHASETDRSPGNYPMLECRQELQDIGDDGRKENPACWVEALLKSNDFNGDVVIEGVRNLGEVHALRARFHRFFLIAVHASLDARWKREQQKYDNDYKRFLAHDRRDQGGDLPYGQQVGKCVQVADYVINNDIARPGPEGIANAIGSLLEQEVALMRSVDIVNLPKRLRPPTPEEAHMSAAYAESHISRCMKRHVGAVILSADGKALSLGFNENPRDMDPCVTLYQSCFKDDDMHRKLRDMASFTCPKCGTVLAALESPWTCSTCKTNLKALFFPDRNLHLCTAIHAEERAILSLDGRSAVGGTIFTTTFPCFYCARKIVDIGITRVVFVEAYPMPEAYTFLIDRRVTVEPFQGFKARAFNLVFRQME